MPALWFYMPWVFVLVLTGCTELAPVAFEGWGLGVIYLMLAAAAVVVFVLAVIAYRCFLNLLHCWHLAKQDHDRLAGRRSPRFL